MTVIVHLWIKLPWILRLSHNPNTEHLGYLHLRAIINNIWPSNCSVSCDVHTGKNNVEIFERSLKGHHLRLTLNHTLLSQCWKTASRESPDALPPLRSIFCSWWNILWVIFVSPALFILLTPLMYSSGLPGGKPHLGPRFWFKVRMLFDSPLHLSWIAFWVKSTNNLPKRPI